MAVIAAIVWVPAIRKPFPNQIQARIPLVIFLFVFTVNPLRELLSPMEWQA